MHRLFYFCVFSLFYWRINVELSFILAFLFVYCLLFISLLLPHVTVNKDRQNISRAKQWSCNLHFVEYSTDILSLRIYINQITSNQGGSHRPHMVFSAEGEGAKFEILPLRSVNFIS